MPVRVAASAGWCFGVKRAMDMAFKAAPACSLGPLIHNSDAVKDLEDAGIKAVETPGEAPEGGRLVIRSHGVTQQEYLLAQSRCQVVDATCPYVSAIHRMVEKAKSEGREVIVAGQASHPEVQGIVSRAGNAQVVASAAEAQALRVADNALLVSQTTLGGGEFSAIAQVLKAKQPRLEIKNTVCRATEERQAEARELAAHSDLMLVVGDKMSANTRRLYEICREICPKTYLVSGTEDLDGVEVKPGLNIGITAGASTPCRKYEEVFTRMNDIENNVPVQQEANAPQAAPEADFASQVDESLQKYRPGQVVTVKVLQITDEGVNVELPGYKMDGQIKTDDLSDTDVKVGDEIEAEVVKLNDGNGNYVLLSQKNIINRKLWDEIVAKFESGEYVEAEGKEATKGGLLCDIGGVRTFVPASQLANHYVDKIDQFVGKPMKLKIIELDKSKKRIVASRKAVLKEEAAARKQEIWSKLEKDAVVKGIVRRLTDFGAFVDVGGVDGLVHVTNLSWGRVAHPSDAVSVGEEIEVKIVDLDPEKERVSLSRKATLPKPWTVAEEKYPVGSIVEGKVVRIQPFGAFVELESGLDGLVHISQCSTQRVNKVEDALNVGDIVRVKVLDVDPERKRISLSVRAALEDEAMAETDDITDEYAIDEDVQEAEAPAEEAAPEAEAPAEEAAPEAEAPTEE